MSITSNEGQAERDDQISTIKNESIQWDLLVIGGGSTGLGVALDAVSRGYRTLLVDQADFAKGTSSRSTKLVHGGVRYLAQGNIKLVREASVERGILHRNAPHLVKNQTFIIPIYSVWDRVKYTIGLKLYDWIAGRLSLGSSNFISRKKTLDSLPGIQSRNLVGGVLYHDGQFDDSRLAINLAQTIIEKGGHALNYTRVKDLIKDNNGRVAGAILEDVETNQSFRVMAKAVINATGVFVDDILEMDNPGSPKTICVSQGIHLVVDRRFFPSEHALMIPETSDGRVLFAVPWHNKVVLGTTDTPVENAELEPKALDKEIEFILRTASGYLTAPPSRTDVQSVFAGLRPLAAPQKDQQKTREISRSHKIIVSLSGLFTILGGKWTTYRKMGEDMVDRIERELHWQPRKSRTAELPIHGYKNNIDQTDPFYFYGADRDLMLMTTREDSMISELLSVTGNQVRFAVRREMARTVEDFLARRTRCLFLDARESIRIAPQVAKIMQEELNKDDAWAKEQLAAFTRLAGQYLIAEITTPPQIRSSASSMP